MGLTAHDYRELARQCYELAPRISLREDRERLMQMGDGYLAVAAKLEAELPVRAPVK